MKTGHILAVMGVALALMLAACGGSSDGDSSGGETPAATESTTPAETGAPAEESADTGAEAAAPSGDPIVIGAPLALTGILSVYDTSILAGAEYAVDEINAQGGVLGRPLELATADTKSEIEQGSVAALEVVDDADAFIVTVDYDFGGPAARVAQEHGIPVFSGAGSPRFGKEGIGDFAFSINNGVTEAAIMAEFVDDQGWKKPYILQDTTIEHTTLACDYFEERWNELAGPDSLAGKDTMKNDDASIAAQITRIRDSDADAIVLCSFNPGGAAAVRQIRGAGIDLPIVAPQSMDGDYWLEAVPDLSNFYNIAIRSIFGDDPDPAVNEFFQKLAEDTGEPPTNAFALLGYGSVYAYARAVEAAGSTDPAAVRDALEQFTDEELPLLGSTTYTADCHAAIGRPMVMIERTNGKAKSLGLLTPESVPETIC